MRKLLTLFIVSSLLLAGCSSAKPETVETSSSEQEVEASDVESEEKAVSEQAVEEEKNQKYKGIAFNLPNNVLLEEISSEMVYLKMDDKIIGAIDTRPMGSEFDSSLMQEVSIELLVMTTYSTAVETEVMSLEMPKVQEVAVAYDIKIDELPSQTTVVGFNDDDYMYFFEFLGTDQEEISAIAKATFESIEHL